MKTLAALVCVLACGSAGTAVALERNSQSPLPLSTPQAQGISAERLTRLHRFIQDEIDNQDYLGAVTLIARNGRIVDWRAYGARDLARTTPMDRQDIFRIYSMTKTLASVAALILMEEGRFTLEDPVSRHLPQFANTQVMVGGSAEAPELRPPLRPITIRHLLTHTAGFALSARDDGPAAEILRRARLGEAVDLQDFVERLARTPLARDPGERFHYDGVATEALSRLIEVISGQSLDRFIAERIVQPLRLRDTGFTVPVQQRGRIAELTTTDAHGKLAPVAVHAAPGEVMRGFPSGAGGLYSTAPDYVRFCQMLLNGGTLEGRRILGRKTVELMMTNHLAQPAPPDQLRAGEGFGLGGSVIVDVGQWGRPGSAGQFGWAGAASTYYTVDPSERLVAILMMQHLPQGLPRDPPRISARFYNLVYQSLEQ